MSSRADDEAMAGLTGLFLGRSQGKVQGRNEGYAECQRDYENVRQQDYDQGYAECQQANATLRQKDFDKGWNEGHTRGWNEGLTAGWKQAADDGNRDLVQAKEVMNRSVELNKQQFDAIQKQRQRIATLEAKVIALGQENAQQRDEHAAYVAAQRAGAIAFNQENTTYHAANMARLDAARRDNAGLRDTVVELKQANEQLTREVASRDEQLQESSAAHVELLREHNRNMVLLNTLRGVLDTLATGNSARAVQARVLFAEKLHLEVERSLAAGTITATLEVDAAFKKQMPKTHDFIGRMLDAALDEMNAGAPEYTDKEFTPEEL